MKLTDELYHVQRQFNHKFTNKAQIILGKRKLPQRVQEFFWFHDMDVCILDIILYYAIVCIERECFVSKFLNKYDQRLSLYVVHFDRVTDVINFLSFP